MKELSRKYFLLYYNAIAKGLKTPPNRHTQDKIQYKYTILMHLKYDFIIYNIFKTLRSTVDDQWYRQAANLSKLMEFIVG